MMEYLNFFLYLFCKKKKICSFNLPDTHIEAKNSSKTRQYFVTPETLLKKVFDFWFVFLFVRGQNLIKAHSAKMFDFNDSSYMCEKL